MFTCLHLCWSLCQQVDPLVKWEFPFFPHFPLSVAAGQKMHKGKYRSSPSLYSLHCLMLPLLHYTPEVGLEPDSHSGASVGGGPPRWR